MRTGDLVEWKYSFRPEYGIMLSLIPYDPYDESSWNPFPRWYVLFPERGILHCRESDLMLVSRRKFS